RVAGMDVGGLVMDAENLGSVPNDGNTNFTLIEIGNLMLVEKGRRRIAVGFAAALAVCVALTLATTLALIVMACAASAASGLPVVRSLADARVGSLLLREGEHYVEAPRAATDIDVTISGPTARARLTQLFNNPTAEWVEAIYVHPLPDGGAVD